MVVTNIKCEEDLFFISLTLMDPCSLLDKLLLDLFHVHLQCAGSLLQVTIINLIDIENLPLSCPAGSSFFCLGSLSFHKAGHTEDSTILIKTSFCQEDGCFVQCMG